MTTIIILSLFVMMLVMAYGWRKAERRAKEAEQLCKEIGDECDKTIKGLSEMADQARHWRAKATVYKRQYLEMKASSICCYDDADILEAEILEEK